MLSKKKSIKRAPTNVVIDRKFLQGEAERILNESVGFTKLVRPRFLFPELKSGAGALSEKEERRIIATNVGSISIYQVGCFLFKAIDVLRSQLKCPNETFADVKLPHKLFSWSLDDFIKRRNMDMLWYSLLSKQLSLKCFEVKKEMVDLNQLEKYSKLVIARYMNKAADRASYLNVMEILKLTRDAVDFNDNFERDYNKNKRMVKALMHNLTALRFVREGSVASRGTSLNTAQTVAVSDKNFTLGYKYKWALAQEDQLELKCQLREKELQDKINHYQLRIDQDLYVSRNTLDSYYNQIEALRLKLSELEYKYSVNYQDILDIVSKRQADLKKMEVQQKFYTDNLVYLAKQVRDIEYAIIREEREGKKAEIKAKIEQLDVRINYLHKHRNSLNARNELAPLLIEKRQLQEELYRIKSRISIRSTISRHSMRSTKSFSSFRKSVRSIG